jgi:hypothetical protein
MKMKYFLALALVVVTTNDLTASIVTYNFTGTPKIISSQQPYGLSITSSTPITGSFEYDTAAPAFSSTGTASIYPQSITNGLSANFGTNLITASNYNVHVTKTTTDNFIVEWISNDTPAPGTPLNVNGTSQAIGYFSVSLSYPLSTFPDTSLPPSLPLTGFNMTNATSFFSQNQINGGVIDVLYAVTAPIVAVPVPEPASWLLSVSGAIVFFIASCLKGRWNALN